MHLKISVCNEEGISLREIIVKEDCLEKAVIMVLCDAIKGNDLQITKFLLTYTWYEWGTVHEAIIFAIKNNNMEVVEAIFLHIATEKFGTISDRDDLVAIADFIVSNVLGKEIQVALCDALKLSNSELSEYLQQFLVKK